MQANAYRKVLAEVGRRVRDARIQAKMTQEDAAAAANIDWRRWQRLEEGAVNATLRTLVRVADAVDTDFWSLVTQSKLGSLAASGKPRLRRN